ncbi:MAG: response regulator transcription factor [Gemmatirosa sp.]
MRPVGRLHKRTSPAAGDHAADPSPARPLPVIPPRLDHAAVGHLRVVLADGDHLALARTTYLFVAEGYRVCTAQSTADARRLVEVERPAMVMIRSLMPDGSGLDFIRGLHLSRAEHRIASILLLSDGEADAHRLRALALGADECLLPDVAEAELVIRARALLRRAAPPVAYAHAKRSDETLVVGPLTLNDGSHEVTLDGAPLHLTRTEFELLRLLMARPNGVVLYEEIPRFLTGGDSTDRMATHRMHMYRLRTKLGERAGMLETIPRRGYVLRA